VPPDLIGPNCHFGEWDGSPTAADFLVDAGPVVGRRQRRSPFRGTTVRHGRPPRTKGLTVRASVNGGTVRSTPYRVAYEFTKKRK
jgi:hypothetical protein